jgi:ATP-binding cassette subfamily F protein uup
LGFDRESQWTPVGDLSGGEKRRLQLTRLLMDSPNVLLLDEPTNDFDIEILTELEDLLDSFAGTLLVISHDRYFLERTCDRVVGLLGDGKVSDLPRGIDQYLELRAVQIAASIPKANTEKKISSAAEERQLKKDLVRIERQMEKLDLEITELEKAQEAAAFNAEELLRITGELEAAKIKRAELEEEWLTKCV